MTIETRMTGQYLRSVALHEGAGERMRALQALSHGYGTGSNAALARLLLASLGGKDLSFELSVPPGITYSENGTTGTIGQIAQPLQECANDPQHLKGEIITAS
ncbi:MAG: hypothetical protein AB8B64_04670 [Granulosicoccus sp.]